ncbi:winged helix DNA-binding protein [Antricoccus suffuscus]|uniref:Winged helix DNA-binding protein n=2 Tax=Antricoccus suffuscus TaxID=1629062 RepID=A0A2T1A3E3_9ACTN|nr:winged helix DNA-binding protein [Antricoccus suffuscus]
MTAVQAQDPGAVTSVALRTAGRDRSGVHEAMDAGEIVKSWPMRGTLHFVAGEDLGWMLGLTAARMIIATAPRRAELGIDDAMIDQARKVAVTALEGGGQLRRSELLALWDEAGLVVAPGQGYRLIFQLAQLGVLCFGPFQKGEQRLVMLDEWVRRPRRLDRDEAVGEWALRYFRSHGPATVKDFAWWTKLLMVDVKAGLAIARPFLERVEVDGVEYFMDPQTPDRLAEHSANAKGVFLLPGFDEFMLGYQDRGAALPTKFAPRLVPGNNGMFMASVVDNGAVVGTWKRHGSGKKATVSATPFTTFTKKAESAIPRRYAALP